MLKGALHLKLMYDKLMTQSMSAFLNPTKTSIISICHLIGNMLTISSDQSWKTFRKPAEIMSFSDTDTCLEENVFLQPVIIMQCSVQRNR